MIELPFARDLIGRLAMRYGSKLVELWEQRGMQNTARKGKSSVNAFCWIFRLIEALLRIGHVLETGENRHSKW